MPYTISQEPANDDVENLFLQILPNIPTVIRKVCVSLGRDPDQMDIDEFAQQIKVLLWKNDYWVLRSFKHESEPETWLFTIAKRRILHWLREGDGTESLDDVPPDAFIVQQNQEEKLLSKERDEMLREVVSKLTEHDKKLYDLSQQERSREEIAEEMRIKKRSVSREINVLMKKLKQIVREKRAI